ncbi:GRAM-domain-containing protein [Moesziomyces antarcticus]|uniref:GRAM-domain-containing protein n=2 Tax=Pseudozyma antarctica TaxID=84753 RepID=A0A081CD70_PSEA2|nr:GRAM-domain-containing protein [Moesziomyces antarcticus]GAK64616.1 GRAM-domain-containing protein [Moesziomyces antarcticus]
MRFRRQGSAKTKTRRLERPAAGPFFRPCSTQVRVEQSADVPEWGTQGPGVFPLGQKGGRDRAWVMHIFRVQLCPVHLLTSVKTHLDFGRPVYQSDKQFCEPHLAHQQQASARGADTHMSSFKNIFRNTNKDSPSAASSSGDHKRTKSTSASPYTSSGQPTLDSSFSRGAYAATNSSVPVSPLSTPVNLPAIDVTDVSSLSPQRPQSSADSDASTLRTAVPPAADDAHPIQSSSVRWDPKGTVPASSSSRSMARPSSSGHSQWRSEPGGALSSTGGGKASRRSSKVDKSDDGHGKSEPLNRHELMRRAMATAQDYHADDHDGDDSGSVFEDDHDHLSNSHHSHGASHHAHNQHHPAHPHPNTSTPLTSRLAPHPDAPSDRPGDGSLSIDAFGNGHPRVVSANANGAHNANPARSSAFPTPATPSKETSSAAAPSQTLTASATMPTIVTPAPIRAELPRSDSLEEIINQGNVYSPNRPASEGLGFQNNGQRGAPQRASTLMDRPISPERNTLQGMSKSASSGALLRPSDVPSAMDGSPRRPSDAGSTSGLGPGSLLRLRKNSDSSTISKMSKGKKNGAASTGIAGALAASGIAGMGVGHAAALQQSQAALADADSTATKKKKDAKRANSANGDDGAAHVSGFQGGIYRDPSTGTVVEKDQDGNQFHPPRPHRDRSTSSFMSYDGSVTSDRSSVSGLGAAAGFGAASAALLSSIGGVPGMPTPMLTPDGGHPIGVGGLVPPEAGGVGGGGDHIDGETTWPDDMGPQITGFAVASSKRNNEFHQLFPQVPEDDYLIEDYGCALVREILTQGRLYISENHLCFKANIFGWVTNVVLPFSEVISIEKRMTAFVIPNAIQIATLQSKHNFTSFLSRDATYDLIVNIWKLSHPGVPIAAADQADLTDEYSEIEDEADSSAAAAGAGGADAKQRDGDQGGKDGGESKPSKRARLKRKLKGTKTGVRDENLAAVAAAAARSGTPLIPQSRSPAPGAKRVAHRKTTCPCEEKKEHFSSVVLDTTYPAVPEKIYNLLFTSGFMKEFWTNDQKLMDLQVGEWSPNAENRNLLTRDISYIKPLAGGFGPKQTKCVLVDANVHVDFDNYVVTLTTTRTPDVPSGGSFCVKTKTCITWEGSGNVSRVYVTCQVEWSGRSMLKSIIDKASLDGQKQYYKELDEAVRKYLTDHASEFKEEGDDAAAVEEIARAATPGPNSRKGAAAAGEAGANNGDRAANGGSGGAGAGSSGDSAGSGGIVDRVMDGLGMVGDLVGGALEMVGLQDVSFKTLAFGVAIVVLLVSNVYTWRRGSGALASSSRMVQHLDGMHAAQMNRGYFSHDGYYGPLSPRRGAGGENGAPPAYERVFAPNVYITPPGGAAMTPEAIAKTVADVLERMYEQNLERFTKGAREADADPETVKRLLAETEAQLNRIERKLKALNQDAAQAGQAATGNPKAEL